MSGSMCHNRRIMQSIVQQSTRPATPCCADEQLAGVLSCVALLEQRDGPAAAGCAWLKPTLDIGEPDDAHYIYYAASRALHARK